LTTGADNLVSVVVPAYNASRFIRESVGSALAQTFTDIEVVVVDDGSAEPVPWVVALDPARVRHHWKENGGPSSARNFGAQQARGALIAFLDADDLWEPTKLERQVQALAARPAAAFAFGAFRTVDEAGTPTGDALRMNRPSGDIAAALFMRNFVVTSSVVMRRRLFEEAGGFEESLASSEDYDLWLRLAERHEAIYVDGVLGSYRTNGQGLSRNFVRMYETERVVIDRALARRARPELARLLPERLGKFHFEFGYDYFVHARFGEARREFARSVRQWPRNHRAWLYLLRAALATRGLVTGRR
jgi:glycosyltransferase involved in cell wall biosynthesis